SMAWKSTQRQHGKAQLLQSCAAAEVGQIDDEGTADDRTSGETEKLERGLGRAASGDQVVDEQHALTALYPIAVHLEPVGAILELVVLPEVLGGQLAAFPNRHETGAQSIGKRGADDEAARFDRGDLVDTTGRIGRNEAIDDGVQRI